ncbi:MAG: fluoride efflux transporter FluC [Phycisphaeraceae bacterium]
MTITIKLLGLAAAGAVGTLARYGLSLAIDHRLTLGGHKLYGTLAVNAIGCLLFGVALAWFDARVLHADHPTRLIVLTGFMGAFTTFSTFAYLSSDLMNKQQWVAAGGYILAHNLVGIALFIVGAAVGAKLAG